MTDTKMRVIQKGILYLVCKEFNLNLDSPGARIRLQEIIYLLEVYGCQMGYGFGWQPRAYKNKNGVKNA